MVKKSLVSIVNLITYIFAGLFLIFFGMQQFDAYGLEGVLIWAGALLALLFLLFIVTRVKNRIADKNNESKLGVLFNIIEVAFILIICFAAYELVLQGSGKVVPVDDWQIAGFAEIIADSKEIYTNQPAISDMFIVSPSVFATVKGLSFVVDIFGSGEIVISLAFMTVSLLTAFFAARAVRMIYGRIAGVMVFAVLALAPSQLSIAFLRNSQILGSCFLVLNILLFMASRKAVFEDKSMWIRLLLLGLSGFVGAFAMFCIPVTAIIIIFEGIYIFTIQTDASGDNLELVGFRVLDLLLSVGMSALVFIILCFMKAEELSRGILEILFGYAGMFIPNDHLMVNLPLVWGRDGYADSLLFYSNVFENSICYGVILGLVFISLLIGWFKKEDKLFIQKICIIVFSIYTFLAGNSTIDHLVMMPILVILAGSMTGLLSVDGPVKAADVSADIHTSEDSDGITDSKTGMMTPQRASDEEVMEEESLGIITVSDVLAKNQKDSDSSAENKDNKNESEGQEDSGFIENPLPLPKKHEAKELDFDIEVADDDDFDIKDVEE